MADHWPEVKKIPRENGCHFDIRACRLNDVESLGVCFCRQSLFATVIGWNRSRACWPNIRQTV
jgi:hypothetical protein